MSFGYSSDRNMKYRQKEIQTREAINNILEEERLNAIQQSLNESSSIDVYNESLCSSFIDNTRRNERLDKELLEEEFDEKRFEVTRKIFVGAVLESLPITTSVRMENSDDMIMYLGECFDGLVENNLLRADKNGAWYKLIESVNLICKDSSKSMDVCYEEAVRENFNLLLGLTERVTNKIENAVKKESIYTTLKESNQYLGKKVSMMRCLTESAIKDSKMGDDAVLQAALDYAILETLNTAKMVKSMDIDYVNQNYKFLKR